MAGEVIGTLAIPVANTKNSPAATAAAIMIFFMAISPKRWRGVLYVQARPEDVMANTSASQGVTFRTPIACIVPTNCGGDI